MLFLFTLIIKAPQIFRYPTNEQLLFYLRAQCEILMQKSSALGRKFEGTSRDPFPRTYLFLQSHNALALCSSAHNILLSRPPGQHIDITGGKTTFVFCTSSEKSFHTGQQDYSAFRC